MQIRFFIIITAVLGVCFSSYQTNKRRENAMKIVKEWTGKEIKFPKGLSCTSMGKDTTSIDVQNDNFKILLYVDSIGCTSCRLRFSEWKKIMNESDSVFVRKPEFVFYFHPKKGDDRELHSIFRGNGFNLPVFIDIENEIGKLNIFPRNPEYQCFVLDKYNKVISIGDPSRISAIWELYKRIISEREEKVFILEEGREFVDGDKANYFSSLSSTKKERRSQKILN